MNSKFLKVFLPLAAVTLLAACGGNTDPATSASPSSDPASSDPSSSQPASEYFITEPTTIEIRHNMNDSNKSRFDNYIDAFKEIEPNVTITNTKISGSYDAVADNIVTGIPANNYPDLFIGYPDAVETMIESGVALRLDQNYINNEEWGWSEDDLEDIIPIYLEEGESYPIQGTYSLPLSKSTEAMFYNASVLIGLNLAAQDSTINGGNALTADYLNNLTWEEFFEHLAPALVAYNATLADSAKIIKEHATYSSMVMGYDSDDNLFITLAEQYGYGYTAIDQTTGEGQLLFNNDGMKSLMKTFNSAKNKGYILTQGTTNGGNYTNYSFTNEACLFSIGSTGGTSYQQSDNFEVGVAPIPHAADRARKVINQGPSLGLLDHKDSNRALAAWLFAKFILNEENSLNWSLSTNYSPIRYSAFESAAWDEYKNPQGVEPTSLEALQGKVATYTENNEFVSNALFVSPVFKGSSEARTQVGGIVTSLLLLTEDACTDEEVDRIFQLAEDNAKKEM